MPDILSIKMSCKVLLVFFAMLLVFFPTKNAFAYLEPGSVSMVLQLLVGVAAAAAVSLKVYWSRLMQLFSKKKREKHYSPSSSDEPK